MTLNLKKPENIILKPLITVFGVGGAGGNATNNMIKSNLEGASFVVANTDAQALENSASTKRIQLGVETTKGLGAGASPDVGRLAAEEAISEIEQNLQGSNMVFITAGMGGGTGTGAAPVIAKKSKEMGILTVAVVTKPFQFEGPRRMKLAEEGIEELQKYVDTLIIIPNQNLFRVANEKTTFADAFAMADEVLHCGVRGITDLMVMPGLINLDFADVRAVMSEMGKAMMGTGEASGESRAKAAAEDAISNPLLDSVSMKGARGVLINITGGPDMTLFEVDEAANRIREEVDSTANIIFGSTFNENLEGSIRVSVVATGIDVKEPVKSLDDKKAFNASTNSFTKDKEEEISFVNEQNLEVIDQEDDEIVNNIDKSESQNLENIEDEINNNNDEDVFFQLEEEVKNTFSNNITASYISTMQSINKEYESVNEQDKLFDEDDEDDDNYFVSQAPVEPKKFVTEPIEQSVISHNNAKQSYEGNINKNDKSSSIFSKLSKVAFPFQSSDNEEIESEKELVATTTSSNSYEKDNIDIPAFLRRKPKD